MTTKDPKTLLAECYEFVDANLVQCCKEVEKLGNNTNIVSLPALYATVALCGRLGTGSGLSLALSIIRERAVHQVANS